MYINKIKQVVKFKVVSVDAPELGDGEVIYLRELSGAQKLKIYSIDKATPLDKLCMMIFESLSDKDGNLTKESGTWSEFIDLLPQELLQRLLEKITELNTESEEAKREIKNA